MFVVGAAERDGNDDRAGCDDERVRGRAGDGALPGVQGRHERAGYVSVTTST